jgi:hypothetical protein
MITDSMVFFSPSLNQFDQLYLCKNCTVMGDLKGAPAVHFNFPLHSFSLYLTFKSGIGNRGGLVNGPMCCIMCVQGWLNLLLDKMDEKKV